MLATRVRIYKRLTGLTMLKFSCFFVIFWVCCSDLLYAQQTPLSRSENPGLRHSRQLLMKRLEQIEKANSLGQFSSKEQWFEKQQELRGQLIEMLGLPSLEGRSTELMVETTGQLELDDIVVEKLHFQSSPGLYVTANLYRPKQVSEPLPAVLYVCGHGQVKLNGVSLGNKTHYQHHPAWFARQGYISMAIDTIQLGEIEGIHHGLFRYNRWDWPSRGYTPAGVEAWNAIRAIDYLVSRSDVDADRIGITGRSGGGAYSWYAAAVDTRIKVAVPVAGITDLRDHVIDQVIRGHCDCMFLSNRYGWDYSTLAAMLHPRSLLIGNTDQDPIFPLDGVFRVQQQVHRIYELESKNKLGIQWTSGGHEDTQELQLGCFVWFDRHLLSSKRVLQQAAQPLFDKSELKVLKSIPSDERVTSVQDWFVPLAGDGASEGGTLPADESAWEKRIQSIREEIEGTVQGRLPDFGSGEVKSNSKVELIPTDRKVTQGDWEVLQMDCDRDSIPCATLLRIRSLTQEADESKVRMVLADESLWDAWETYINPNALDRERVNGDGLVRGQILGEAWRSIVAQADSAGTTYLVFPERRGPWRWDADEKSELHWKRSYLLVGWSLEGRQVADAVCVVQALCAEHGVEQVALKAGVQMSVHALHVALLAQGAIESLELHSIDPQAYFKGFVLMGVLRFCDLPEVLACVSSKVPTRMRNAEVYRKMPLFEHLEKQLGLLNVQGL